MVRAKPADTRPAWYRFVSHQFRDPELGGGLRRKDIAAIEHLLRRGEKMLDSYGSPGVKNVVLPVTADWPLGWAARPTRREERHT
ncbi:hypothetical protein JCM10021v2_007255 [Rhodotorula toruloides]